MRCCWFIRPKHQVGAGRRAREQAERDLEATIAETPKYERLGRELRGIRRENHLAQAFLKAAGGKS